MTQGSPGSPPRMSQELDLLFLFLELTAEKAGGKLHNAWHTVVSEHDRHWVSNKSGKQKHLEAGFWQRQPEEEVCIMQSMQLFQIME